MDERTRQHLAIFGNQQLDSLGAEMREFVQDLWKLSHYGALDTFSYFVSEHDVTSTGMFFTLIRNGILEKQEQNQTGYGDYRIRFHLDWRRYLEYVQARPAQPPSIRDPRYA